MDTDEERRERVEDELLVLSCRGGDAEAFRRLVERWQARLWRHARRLTGHDDAAWDVLQEAWMGIARGIRRLEDPARFRAWAFAIVTRRAADRARRRPREVPLVDPPREVAAPDAEEPPPDGPVELLRRALLRLPADERALLALRYTEGLDVREVAAALGIPEGTAKSRLHHARETLRDIIERIGP